MKHGCLLLLSVLWQSKAAAFETSEHLDLCRVLVAEIGLSGSTAEASAVLHVLQRRRDTVPALRAHSLATVAKLYSTSHNGRAVNVERAARMRALRLDEIPQHIQRLVTRWLAGHRPANVCPNAVHFAAPSVRSPLRRVQCAVPTVNHFYEAAR